MQIRIIIGVIWVSVFIIACALYHVINLNRTENTFLQLGALILGGLSVLAATYIVPLKSEFKEFTVYEDIIINKPTGLVVNITELELNFYYENLKKQYGENWMSQLNSNNKFKRDNNQYIQGLKTLHDFSKTQPKYDGKPSAVTQIEINDDNKEEFYLELIIYKIANDLKRINFSKNSFTTYSTKENEDGTLSYEVKKKQIKLPDLENHDDELQKELSKMSFYDKSMAFELKKLPSFWLPKNSDIKIDKYRDEDNKMNGGIIISKPNFFDITFQIEIVYNEKSSALPEKLENIKIDPDIRANLTARSYAITVSGDFKQLRSSSFEMGEYKKWFDWLKEEFEIIHSNEKII
jgi:hypothetical protein